MKIEDRRQFLVRAGLGSAALGVPFAAGSAFQGEKKSSEKPEEEVSPTEDLMREHGLLNRILLIYDHAEMRLSQNQDFDPAVLASAADIVKRFVEEYHEKLEENHLFPRFRKANKLTDLVSVLLSQHEAGRTVTSRIQQMATASTLKNSAQRKQLGEQLHAFIGMYRPHEAREDTVLFPALHQIVSKNEFDSLGEEFEKQEDQLFGEDGFEHMVDKVAGLEKTLGIYNLAQFTPK